MPIVFYFFEGSRYAFPFERYLFFYVVTNHSYVALSVSGSEIDRGCGACRVCDDARFRIDLTWFPESIQRCVVVFQTWQYPFAWLNNDA